jgi:hypothetical protein
MFSKGTLGVAVCAALASAAFARANQSTDSPMGADQLSLNSAAYIDDATPPPPPKPLMGLLEAVGVGKPLEAANINLYGFVEGGYTYSFNPPPGGVITGNVFNTKQNRIVLDQADIAVERTVDITQNKFDIGGKIELTYGWDASSYHSNGLFSYYKFHQPENQFDITQAYLDFAIPVGSGLDIRVGKFVTLLGEESINPTANYLYSHSYLFGYAIPFTQTGILAKYNLNSAITLQAGVTRGWNQSRDDNNGVPDFLGQVAWTISKATSLTVNVSEGPQATDDNSDWWTVVDVILSQTVSDNLTVVGNADYGDAPHALGTTSAQWYGFAGYASLTLDPHATINFRAEAYDDNNGFTLGTGTNIQVYEATLGVAVTPLPDNAIAKNFSIRPEVRYDYASHDYFNGGARHDQLQVAVDAIFTF